MTGAFRLGQNFLVDERLVRRLVARAVPGDLVVDFGAGNDALGSQPRTSAPRVIAVERDPVWTQLQRRVRAAAFADRVPVVHRFSCGRSFHSHVAVVTCG